VRERDTQDTKQTEGLRNRGSSAHGGPSSSNGAFLPLGALHGAIGNRGVGRLIQARIKVNEPGDIYEQEADRMAEVVMRKKVAPCRCGGTCRHCRAKREETLQRQAEPVAKRFKQATLQAPATPSNPASTETGKAPSEKKPEQGTGISVALKAYISQSLGRGQPLGPATRRFMENAFEQDFGPVRIHTDRAAAQATKALSAHAFTLGNSIWFGRGQYQPHSSQGQHLLAHELAHTVQQRGSIPSLQRNLLVGAANDPAEGMADHAAAAVTRRSPVPRISSAPSLLRCARVRSYRPEGTNAQIVEMDDGARYRVTRTRSLRQRRRDEPLPPRVRVGADTDDIFLRIEWCRGATRGNVRIGANVPEQARGLAQRIFNIIQSGGSSEEVVTALQETDISPFVDFVIAQAGEWQLTGEVSVTAGRRGVTAGGGRIGFRRGPLDVGVRAQGSEEGGVSVTGEVRITPGQTSERFRCETRERVEEVVHTDYRCERFTPARTEQRTRPVQRTDVQTRYIYFDYALSTIDEARSAGELSELSLQLAEGYQVTNVEGFTSPEGPMGPGRRFRGNVQLAEDRAQTALRRVQQLCSQSTSANAPSCASAAAAVSPLGRGELYTLTREEHGRTREARGRELATHAVGEFRAQPEEERHRTPALEQALQQARTPEQQADLIYPLLRRAVITLTREVTEQERYQARIPAGYQSVACPPEVLEAARNGFRLQDAR
jgi:Domain of unknown function (DUF4157)